jgi:hypothetical protein
VGDPPPSDESAQESSVRRLDGGIMTRQWRLGFGPNSHGIGDGKNPRNDSEEIKKGAKLGQL